MTNKRLYALLLIIATLALFEVLLLPVLASTTIAYPDVQMPMIEAADVYNNYLEADDMLIVGRYWVEWTTAPNATIDETMVGRFTTPSNVELSRVAPYPYYNRGYHHGIFAMYMTADEVVASGISWGGSYLTWLAGAISVNWTSGGVPTTPPYGSTSTITWHNQADVSTTSVLLGVSVLTWADTLSNQWSVALTQSSTRGNLLSTYGAQYFTNAIPNLQVACPQVFSASMSVPQYVEPTAYPPYGGTTVPPTGTAPVDLGGLAAWLGFGGTDDLFKFVLYMIFLGVIAFWVSAPTAQPSYGAFCVLVGLPIGAALHIISWTLVGVAAMMCVLALGITLLFLRSSY